MLYSSEIRFIAYNFKYNLLQCCILETETEICTHIHTFITIITIIEKNQLFH